jgi:hypothetical protein
MDTEEQTSESRPLLKVNVTKGGMLAGSLMVAAVFYGLLSRPIGDVLRYSALVAGGLSVSVLGGVGSGWIRSKRGRPSRNQVAQFLVLLIAVPVLGGPVYYGLFATMADLYRLLLPVRQASLGASMVAALAMVAGLALFWLRLRVRLVYGLSEVMVGLAIAAWRGYGETTSGVPSTPEFYLAILTASIYLVVRGLDNMHQALQAGSDPAFNFVKKYVNSPDVTVTITRNK